MIDAAVSGSRLVGKQEVKPPQNDYQAAEKSTRRIYIFSDVASIIEVVRLLDVSRIVIEAES